MKASGATALKVKCLKFTSAFWCIIIDIKDCLAETGIKGFL